jgi:hypothetical protein
MAARPGGFWSCKRRPGLLLQGTVLSSASLAIVRLCLCLSLCNDSLLWLIELYVPCIWCNCISLLFHSIL